MSDVAQMRKRVRRAGLEVREAKERIAKMQLALHLRKLAMEIPVVKDFLAANLEWGRPAGAGVFDDLVARLREDYACPPISPARLAALEALLEKHVGGLTATSRRRRAKELAALVAGVLCEAAPIGEAEAATSATLDAPDVGPPAAAE